ncbi:flippase-like domain-containing protein [Candidatus Aerophobetes bacterium]|nr:flippase-like domain-containing protein [Candidatus Aerophobetes bacterium]
MKRNFVFLISTLVGIALFVLVFYLFNIAKVFSHMFKIGPWGMGVFFINVFLIMLIGALSWQVILRAYGHNLPFKDVLIIKTIGFAISYLTPSMYIGGEPMRVYLMGKKHSVPMTRIGATVVVDKLLELGAILFFVFLGSIYTLIYYRLPLQLFILLVLVNAFFLGAMVLLLINFIFKTKLFSKTINLLGKFKPLEKPVEVAAPFMLKLESEVFSAFGKHSKSTIQAFLLNLGIGSLIFVKPAIFFHFLRITFNLSQLSLLYALTHLLLVLQFTPGAIGIFEWGEVGIFSIIGIQSEKALAYALMVRIADILVVIAAAVTGFHMGVKYLWGKKRNEDLCGI